MVLKVAYSQDDRDELIKKGFKKIGTAEDKDGEEIVIFRSTRKKRTPKKDKSEESKSSKSRSRTTSTTNNTNSNNGRSSRSRKDE